MSASIYIHSTFEYTQAPATRQYNLAAK